MIGKNLSIQGLVHVQQELDGEVIQECWAENRMVDGGLGFIIDRVVDREFPPDPAPIERIGGVKYGDSAVATTSGMTDIQGTEFTHTVGLSICAGLIGSRIHGGDGSEYKPFVGLDFGGNQTKDQAWRHFIQDPPKNVLEIDLDISNVQNPSGTPFFIREIGLYTSDWDISDGVDNSPARYSYKMVPQTMVARVVVPDFVMPAAPTPTRLRSRWFFAMGNVPADWTENPRYPFSQNWFDAAP